MNHYCIDCGSEYPYDTNNPLGASSERCSSCRKKDSKRNKKIILLNIAGHGSPACRMCGYSRVSGLTLVDGVLPIKKPSTQSEIEAQASKQFVLCLNCEAQIKAGEVSFKVKNSKPPMEIEFYSRHVRVVEEPIKTAINFTHDALETEVTKDEPKLGRAFREKEIPRIESTIEVPTLPV